MSCPPDPLAAPGDRRPRRYQPFILELLKWGPARPIDIYHAMGYTKPIYADRWISTQYLYIIRNLRVMEKAGLLKCTRVKFGREHNGAYYQLIGDEEPCLLPTPEERKEREAVRRKLTREAWHRSQRASTVAQREAATQLEAAWPERS